MVKSRDGQTLTIELPANVAAITLVKSEPCQKAKGRREMLEVASIQAQGQRPAWKRYTGMAAAPHPYPWATLAQWRRHRVGRESGLNQDHDSSQHLRRLVLGSILVLAAALRCWRLDAAGFIVPYYFAGVRSMMGSLRIPGEVARESVMMSPSIAIWPRSAFRDDFARHSGMISLG
jgi:hypothetical protein